MFRESPKSAERLDRSSARVETMEISYDPKQEAIETLKKINFKILREIFSELQRKSGVGGREGFVFPGNIVIQNIKKKSAKEAGVAGAYARGKIYLYPDQLARNPFEKSGRFTKQEIGNQILCVLIHEETHATAKNQDTSIPSKII